MNVDYLIIAAGCLSGFVVGSLLTAVALSINMINGINRAEHTIHQLRMELAQERAK